MACSGNINPSGVSLFEPVNGSSPAMSGKNVANPMGAILTAGMMLDHLGFAEAAAGIEAAVTSCVRQRQTTPDVGGTLGTREVGSAVIARL